jgi:penicillin amidase
MIPWERMPREIDPPSGRVVTANNRIVSDDHPDYLCTDCHPTYRADRVRARLDALTRATVEDMASVHRDTFSRIALELRTLIVAVPAEGEAERWRKLIEGWDGRMDAGALAPSAYYLVRREMTRVLARLSGLDRASGDPFAQVAPGIPPLNQLWWTLPNLVRANDTSLLDGTDWESVAREALATVSAREELVSWGELHRPRFVHPLSTLFPSEVSEQVSGDGDCVCANGAYASGGVAASYGPVARYAFDLGSWDDSRWVVFHGASGHPASPHYGDQNTFWARGEMVPAPYTEAAVDANAAARLILRPRA